VLVYRTGAYAPNGVPYANGYVDYLKLTNARGGINGVKVLWEECETGYATDRGVECYERLKGKNGGATVFQPLSTGITFALTEKAPNDKIPLITAGYGRSESTDGMVFKWNFPLTGTYWDAADILLQHLSKKEGGWDKLRGKKISLVYHDSPYGKEPIPLLQNRAAMHGFELNAIPVTHPGVEQKAAWLQIRQNRPDYVLLWGWGVMNSTALKEAVATGYPRDKMYGVWWAAAEPDVKDVGDAAKGYSGLALQHGAEPNSAVAKEVIAKLHDKGQGTGPKEEVGTVLYMRGLKQAMLAVEGVKRAQERFGKGKVMTGEQTRWGLENMALDQKKLDALGFAGVLRPISTSCADHRGDVWARIHTWDGAKWSFTSDWYQADQSVIKPMIKAAADKYATEKKIERRTPADCQS
jgi:branched-chain amino acid transport system substrate-binding protein